jgi:hypothetical protein
VAEREASGDFDYLWDDPADAYGLTSHDQALETQQAEKPGVPPNEPDDDQWDEPDDSFWDNQLDPDDPGHFDAFNNDTWSFTPAPTPWYRTGQAVTATIAASAAMVAIVVSGVLLVFRGPVGTVNQVTSSVTPTAPTSAAPVQVANSQEPPPPAPPPPPSETAASQVNTAPTYNQTYEPRPTKAPEIGVTRTPITRLPISVAPRPRTHTGMR